MKKFLIILSLVVILGAGGVLLYFSGSQDTCLDRGGVWDKWNKKCYFSGPKSNQATLEKIAIGMTVQQVVDIMGEPVHIRDYPKTSLSKGDAYGYFYPAPFGASGDFIIFFAKDTNLVDDIYKGE